MALEDDIRILRAAPLLSDIPIDGLRLLAFAAEHQMLAKGEALFRAGEAANGGFVLVSGEISLSFGSRAPQRLTQAGQMIEELALFCELSRLSTAVADAPTHLLQLPRSAFVRMLGEYPDSVIKLHNQLAARLRADAAELAAIGEALDNLDKR